MKKPLAPCANCGTPSALEHVSQLCLLCFIAQSKGKALEPQDYKIAQSGRDE